MNIPLQWIKKLQAREGDNALRALSFYPKGIDFYSNDYLGLARSKELPLLAQHILQKYGEKNGSTGSRLIAGNNPLIEDTETFLADFYQAEKALIFSTGYVANLGLMSCIAERNDTILYDSLSHASIRDGIRLSFAASYAFHHNDLADLEKRLQKAKGTVFVVTETLFSMDGDVAPLEQILELCARYQAYCIVDEAHAVGVFEKGLSADFATHPCLLARVVTFGKAMGIHGAAILGSKELCHYLINYSRAFIYTTAMPDYAVASIWASHQCVLNADAERKQLGLNIAYFRKKAMDNGLQTGASLSPIQVLIQPGNGQIRKMEQLLKESEILCKAILSPTVAEGQERLRITLHSYNTFGEIDRLIDRLLLCKSAI